MADIFCFRDRGTILLLLDDQGQLHEFVVPNSRMDLIALLVDRGSDNELHYSNYVDDRFRRKSCCRQNLYELAQGTIPHFRH